MLPAPWIPLLLGMSLELVGVAGLGLGQLAGVSELGVGVGVFGVGCAGVAAFRRRRRLGWANGITLLRLVGVGWAIALALTSWSRELEPGGQVVLIGVGVACLVLDGVDGRVARSRGEVGAFGARFDLETDAALLAALAVAVAALGLVGWWVLAIGAARYLYVLAAMVLRPLRTPLPERYSRKVVAVLQGVGLLACLLLGLTGWGPAALPALLTGAALAALLWSFGRDIVGQLRAARSVDPTHPATQSGHQPQANEAPLRGS